MKKVKATANKVQIFKIFKGGCLNTTYLKKGYKISSKSQKLPYFFTTETNVKLLDTIFQDDYKHYVWFSSYIDIIICDYTFLNKLMISCALYHIILC